MNLNEMNAYTLTYNNGRGGKDKTKNFSSLRDAQNWVSGRMILTVSLVKN